MHKQWAGVSGDADGPFQRVTRSFESGPESVSRARSFVAETLESWDVDDVSWTALQLVSELATNAVIHARSAFSVHLVHTEGSIQVGVQDFSPVVPFQRWYSERATTGRGLRLVASLAENWGVESTQDGKTIWFETLPSQELPVRAWEDTQDLELEGLASRFTDFGDSMDDLVLVPQDELLAIHALNLPLQLWAASKQHMEGLLREFELICIARDRDSQEDTPARLLAMVALLTQQYGPGTALRDAPILAALEAGQTHMDHTMIFPIVLVEGTLRMVRELGSLLEESDEYCRQGEHLLTLATPPIIASYRRWYLREVTTQLQDGEATPWVDPEGWEGTKEDLEAAGIR